MSYDTLMTDVIIPMGETLVYDLAKLIFVNTTENLRLERLLKSVIKKSVAGAFEKKKEYEKLIEAIENAIFDSCKKNENVDITRSVEREFKQWGIEYNKRVVLNICNNLQKNIVASPDLSILFTADIVRKLLEKFELLQAKVSNEYNTFEYGITTISQENKRTNVLLSELVKSIQELSGKIVKAEADSKYVLDAYKNHLTNPLFLEKSIADGKMVNLFQVYIKNEFRILEFPHHNSHEIYNDVIQFIQDFIEGKLLHSNYYTSSSEDSKHIKVLFVKGHPGSGKSSLFYYLAHMKGYNEQFFPEHRFHFVKLIEVYDIMNGKMNTLDPMHDIEAFIGKKIDPWQKTVLVLDGLDEVCVAKGFDANEYCMNLIRQTVGNKRNLHVIITTRLNYVSIANKNVINIQLLNLSCDDLQKWTEKYFEVHDTLKAEREIAEKNIEFIRNNADKEISEIFAIPLLFYMIVVSRIDISKIDSIGQLYDQVFDELRERNYNEAEEDFMQKHTVNSKIPVELARQIAIEISYEMYISNKLLLEVQSEKLDKALERAYLPQYKIREKDKEDIELLYPITFFYKAQKDVVEFAHKSIMEFFAAEKLYQVFMDENMTFEQFINSYILNPVIISKEVLSFFMYFISQRTTAEKLKAKYPQVLNEFVRRVRDKKCISNENVTLSFELDKLELKVYWFFAKNVMKYSPAELSSILNEEFFQKYVVGCLSINDTSRIPILEEKNLNYDFSEVNLNSYIFRICNMSYIDYSKTVVDHSSFYLTNMQWSNFRKTKFRGMISFKFCDLANSVFEEIDMKTMSEKRDADKTSIIFEGCNLYGVSFKGGDLRDTSFKNMISLEKCNFKQVILNLSQLHLLANKGAKFNRIKLIVREEDFTPAQQLKIRRSRKERGEAIKNIVIASLSKYIDAEIIDGLMVCEDFSWKLLKEEEKQDIDDIEKMLNKKGVYGIDFTSDTERE